MKTFKSLITISALLLGTTSVFAMSHAGAPMAKDDAKKSMPMATSADMAEIENILPAGFAHGNRYSTEQQGASEQYG